QGNYLLASRYKDIVFTAGMTPRKNGKLIQMGKVNLKNGIEFYKNSIELATSNALLTINKTMSEDEEIHKILSLVVYINTDLNFESHTILVNCASILLYEELGSNGISSRAAVGVSCLPGNSTLEIMLVASIINSD